MVPNGLLKLESGEKMKKEKHENEIFSNEDLQQITAPLYEEMEKISKEISAFFNGGKTKLTFILAERSYKAECLQVWSSCQKALVSIHYALCLRVEQLKQMASRVDDLKRQEQIQQETKSILMRYPGEENLSDQQVKFRRDKEQAGENGALVNQLTQLEAKQTENEHEVLQLQQMIIAVKNLVESFCESLRVQLELRLTMESEESPEVISKDNGSTLYFTQYETLYQEALLVLKRRQDYHQATEGRTK